MAKKHQYRKRLKLRVKVAPKRIQKKKIIGNGNLVR